MKIEIQNASNFLTSLLRLKCPRGRVRRLEQFSERLEHLLGEHYRQHWFPDSPCKGSGYRCIRINHKMDPILSRAGAESGFDDEGLRELFPDELTLWVDPCEVSYRIGENGSICVLYEETTTPTKINNNNWHPSTPVNARRRCPSTSDYNSSSPMSVSPESCKGDSFIMDPTNTELELSIYCE